MRARIRSSAARAAVLLSLGAGFVRDGRAVAGETPPAPLESICEIALVHFSHTDYGFTDHPAVCRDLQRRYLDIAIDAARATREHPEGSRFRWTAETTVAVEDWWRAASPERREALLEALRRGEIEVSALPFNNTPFLDREQWRAMLRWLPEQVREAAKPRSAIQNDVNGFPRAGALALLDRGVRYLFSGINVDSGGTPFPRLTAFWWKMPDGRRLFVWLSLSYGDGFYLFEREEWRRGPVPVAWDARYRLPRRGEILSAEEPAVRAAHAWCLERLRGVERAGYRLPVLVVSITNMWRYDNDPPFPPLADFVAAWNRLGLEPRLRLATVTEAMESLERVAGASAPEYEGEWTDWWANGTASAPREVAASRAAKRLLAAARSSAFGPLSESAARTIEELTRDLALFDEHTWGSSMSVAQPFTFDALGQWNEKARLAWRPLALAEHLVGQRLRTSVAGKGEGLWLANAAAVPYSGWVRLPRTSLRGDFRSVVDPETGERAEIEFERGVQPWGRPREPEDLSPEDVSATFSDRAPNRVARFWVEGLPPGSLKRFALSTEPAESAARPAGAALEGPEVELDPSGWPARARWPGMEVPLFAEGLGDFVAVRVRAFAPRWALRDIWEAGDAARREALRKAILELVPASPAGRASAEETPHTLRYEQALVHPRLAWAVRRLELFRREPRARLVFRVNRISSHDPEIFGIVSAIPADGTLPRLSSGGVPFTPFTDQLPGTCRDYFAIDGWAHYATAKGHWLWASRDAPLVAIDGPHPLARLGAAPERTGRLVAMVYNSFWYTNFLGDSPGVMEFQFDLLWRPEISGPAEAEALAGALVSEPFAAIEPGIPEDPLFERHLYRP